MRDPFTAARKKGQVLAERSGVPRGGGETHTTTTDLDELKKHHRFLREDDDDKKEEEETGTRRGRGEEEEAEEEFDTLANHGGIYCILEDVLYFIDVVFYPFTIYDVYKLEKGDEALIPLFSSLYEYPIDFSKLENEDPSNYNSSLTNWEWLLDCLSEENITEDFSWYTYRSPDDIPETVDEGFYESLINFLIRG